LSEGAKMSYADVLAATRKKIPLKEIGVDSIDMKKAMTGAIIIRVPGDRDGGKAFRLATHLAEVLDPTAVRVVAPTRTAEMRVVGIDISVDKEELQQALTSAAGCGSAEVQVGEIGLGSAWIRCPVAGARKLAPEGKVALGWSKARVISHPKEDASVLQMPGTWTRTHNLRVHRGSRTSVLQVRRKRTSVTGAAEADICVTGAAEADIVPSRDPVRPPLHSDGDGPRRY
jgi:hypothetical protein